MCLDPWSWTPHRGPRATKSAFERLILGTGHNETDWGARLDEPLLFLMGAR